MNLQEMRDKSETDLRQELTDLKQEQFNLRMQRGTGQLARPHELKRVRRDIARIETILGEKAREGQS